MRKVPIAAVVLTTSALSLASAGAASAASTSTERPRASGPSVGTEKHLSSGLKITFSQRIPAAQRAKLQQKIARLSAAHEAEAMRRPAAAQRATLNGSGTIWCNGAYWWWDSNGRFDVQRMCGSRYAPWGFRMSAAAQGIVKAPGYVKEYGLDWTRNGVKQPRMAPHTVYKNYTFHGTFGGLSNGSIVNYNDVIAFPCNLGYGCQATLSFRGKLTFSGTVWHP